MTPEAEKRHAARHPNFIALAIACGAVLGAMGGIGLFAWRLLGG